MPILQPHLYTNADHVYMDVLDGIYRLGVDKVDRTSVGGNRALFGTSYRFGLTDNGDTITMPFMQLRAFSPRMAFTEWRWMTHGNCDVSYLQERGFHFWDDNTTEEFLNKNGRGHIEPNTIGKSYSYQMRKGFGVDQLKDIYDGLKSNPYGRRHVISFWNPGETQDMALEPCHLLYIFNTLPGEKGVPVLNLSVTMRSSDYYLAGLVNTSFAAFWLVAFAKSLGYEVGEILFNAIDIHIYQNAIPVYERLKSYYDNEYFAIETARKGELPKIRINKEMNSFEDMLALDWSDIEVIDFTMGSKDFGAPMAV